MSGEKITVTITPKGMKVEASGFPGKTCLAELAKMEKFLKDNGIEVKTKETKLKAEVNSFEYAGTQQEMTR
jgi:hypothetical protein